MSSKFLIRSFFFLSVLAALTLLMVGCPIPMQSAASSANSTGAVTGKVLAQGQKDNGGVTITAEQTDGIRSLSVQKAVASGKAVKAVTAAAQATTDANGTYTLTGLPAGVYTLNAVSADGLSKAVTTSVTVSAGSTTEAVLMILTQTGQIQGVVTLKGGADLTGIVVFVAGTSYSAMTDGSGNFLMSYVPAGTNYTLVASKVGYSSWYWNVNVGVNSVTKVDTKGNALSYVLQPYSPPATTGQVSGIATLSDLPSGQWDGIFVYLQGSQYICVTDTKGNFTLTGVAASTNSYTLVASKVGYTSISAQVTVSANSTFNVSGTLSLTVIPPAVVSAPTFSPSTGGFNSNQTVTIYDATPGAMIYYTLATATGQTLTPPLDPDPTSPSQAYGDPIQVGGDGTVTIVKAIATKAGMTNSSVSQSTYRINYSPNRPHFVFYDPNGGKGDPPVDPTNYLAGFTVTVLGNGSLVYEGCTFAGWNTQQNGGGATYLQGKTFPMGNFDVTLYAVWTPPTPTGLAVAYQSSTALVANWTASSGATSYQLYRSTSESGPFSQVYSGSATSYPDAGLTPATTYYYEVRATNNAGSSPLSTWASATTYVFPVAIPTFSPAIGGYTSPQTVTISTTTSGATIRYTTDGSTPSSTVGTVYSDPISILTTTTIKAIAYESGWTDSSVASATYTITVATPMVWTDRTTAGSRGWSAIACSADGSHIAACVSGGDIWTSTDGGATWTDQTTFGAGSRAWSAIACSADGSHIAACDCGPYGNFDIWTSTDGGATWTDQTTAGSRAWSAIACSADGSHIVACALVYGSGGNGNIWTSYDGGATWTDRTTFGAGSRAWSAIACSADGSHIVACALRPYGLTSDIWTSTDGGATWTDQTTFGYGSRAWSAIACSADGSHIAACDCGPYGNFDIWTSTDGSATWTDQTTAGSRAWSAIACSADGSHIAACVTGGEILTGH